MLKRRFGGARAKQDGVAVTGEGGLGRKNLFLGSWQVDQGSADVSPHRRQFGELRILLVGDSANAEKWVLRGFLRGRISQV